MSLKTVLPWYLTMTSKFGSELFKGTQAPPLPSKVLGAIVVVVLLMPILHNLRPFFKPIFIFLIYAIAKNIYFVLSTLVGIGAYFIKAPVPKVSVSVVAYLLYLQHNHAPPKEKNESEKDTENAMKAKVALKVLYNLLKEEFNKVTRTALTKGELKNVFQENIKPKLPHPFNITASSIVVLMLILKVAFKTEGMLVRAPYEIMKIRKTNKG